MKWIMVLIFLGNGLAWMVSCVHTVQNSQTKKEVRALSLLENFYYKGASLKDIVELLGEPNRTYKYEGVAERIYAYNHKTTGFKEWSFAVNDRDEVVWLNHKQQSNPLLDRVEILHQTWKKYRCKKTFRSDTSVPHVVQKDTFFECAGGRIRAFYNVHGEVGTIFVFSPKMKK